MENLLNFGLDIWVIIRGALPVLAIGVLFVVLEHLRPRRQGAMPDGLKWVTGAALTTSGWLLAAVMVPVTAGLSAIVAADAGYGLLNRLDLWLPLTILLGFMAYDAVGYMFHRILHEVPGLWRLHRTHHTDTSVDASTALRVHPLEPMLGSLLAIVMVALIGIPPEGIFLHFLFMSLFNFWHHANVRPFPGQRSLSLVFNIPELHEVHHSVHEDHHNANYGAVLSIWDRMFGTLINDARLDGTIEFGLDKAEWDHPQNVTSLMIDPIRK